MKTLIRWSATLSILGGILLGSFAGFAGRALALTQEQVAERLRSVPVFTLTDSQGSPLIASPAQGEQGTPVAGVFISQQDAQNFLDGLRQSNPNLARDVQIRPVSLAEVYQLARQAGQQSEPLEFAFIPIQQEVQTARSLLQESGQNADQFRGVPLFLARSGDANTGGYLTIRQGESQVIPLFFKREELQTLIDRVRQQQPSLASNISIQVINLEGLIQTLQNSDNTELNRIILIPPNESVEYMRSIAPQQGTTPRPGQPATPQRPAQPAPQRTPQQ
ncbi:MAG TPA: Tic22 family protein [Crinalium sp.]|jgi:nickel transport protein